jgi:molybdopterin molybdotransferase
VVGHGRPAAGQVRDAIGPMLPGLVNDAGGVVGGVHRVADEKDALEASLDAVAGDVVVVSGGSSAGPADHLRGLLEMRDAAVHVGSVASRPGHPQQLARLPDGRWVVGLPGNPNAALVSTMTLLVPLVTTLAGRPPPATRFGRLTTSVTPHARDTRLVAVRESDGGLEHVGHDRSGNLWGAALADALAVIPPGAPSTWVQVLQMPGVHRFAGETEGTRQPQAEPLHVARGAG